MISSKYTKDYTLSYEMGPGGRLRSTAVYAGKYYSFAAEEAELKARRRVLLALLVGAAVLLLVLLTFSNVIDTRYRYLSLPISFDVIALVFVILGVWRICTAGERFVHRRRDQIENRFPAALFFFLLLSALSFGAMVVLLFLAEITVPRLLYTAAALGLAVLSALLFAQRKLWHTVELPGQSDSEPEELPPPEGSAD